jgi:hypothetical protein
MPREVGLKLEGILTVHFKVQDAPSESLLSFSLKEIENREYSFSHMPYLRHRRSHFDVYSATSISACDKDWSEQVPFSATRNEQNLSV